MTEHHNPEHRADMFDEDVEDLPAPASILFGNKAYDLIKLFALVVLPAVGTLYFGIAGIWGLPAAEEVVGTIVVVDTFLGVLLGVAGSQYKNSDARIDGQILVEPDYANEVTNLNVQLDPSAVAGKDEVVLKINRV